jgi:hypothetical protein
MKQSLAFCAGAHLDRRSKTWEWTQMETQLLDDPTARRMLRDVNVQDCAADYG